MTWHYSLRLPDRPAQERQLQLWTGPGYGPVVTNGDDLLSRIGLPARGASTNSSTGSNATAAATSICALLPGAPARAMALGSNTRTMT
jgi:hypothetical protein